MTLRAINEKRSEDPRLNPQVMVEKLIEAIRDEELEVERIVVVIETPDGLDVRGSGWHGDDVAPAVCLLEAGKLSLLIPGGDS